MSFEPGLRDYDTLQSDLHIASTIDEFMPVTTAKEPG